MPRPPKRRRVEFEPSITYFKPAGVPKWQLSELILSIEEVEAIRLKDKEGLEQEECAVKMGVSRPTFQRMLISARAKIAEAISEGKAIRIEGGNYKLATNVLMCNSCRHQFEIHPGRHGHGHAVNCPICGFPLQK